MPKIGDVFNPHRMFNGIFIPDAVFHYRGLSPVAKLIYGRLIRYKGEAGEAYPSAATLGKEIDISDRQVFEHLKGLEDAGLIARESRAGISTVYNFLWHPCFETDEPYSPEVPMRKSSGVLSKDVSG